MDSDGFLLVYRLPECLSGQPEHRRWCCVLPRPHERAEQELVQGWFEYLDICGIMADSSSFSTPASLTPEYVTPIIDTARSDYV